jgi:hypothetical protein
MPHLINNEEEYCHRIIWQLNKYQKTLRDYIRKEVFEQPHLYIYFYNREWSITLETSEDPVINMYSYISPDLVARDSYPLLPPSHGIEAAEKLNTLIRQHPNLGRALVNYSIAQDALNIISVEDLPSARISRLYDRYKNIERNFREIGNSIVDNATTGLCLFFRRLWAKVTFYFSAQRQQEKQAGRYVTELFRHYYFFHKTAQEQQVLHNPAPSAIMHA